MTPETKVRIFDGIVWGLIIGTPIAMVVARDKPKKEKQNGR